MVMDWAEIGPGKGEKEREEGWAKMRPSMLEIQDFPIKELEKERKKR